MLTILKVIEYEKTVAIEFEVERGYPDTFTQTWEELLRQLPPDSGRAECVVLATLLLQQREDAKVQGNKQGNEMLDLARKALEG